MRGLNNATDKIRRELVATGLINEASVLIARPDDFVRDKREFYPAALVDYESASIDDRVVTLSMELVIFDVVDEDLQNEEDVLAVTLAVIARVVAVLQKSDPSELFHLNEDATLERVYEDSSHNLSGWKATFNLDIVNQSHAS